MRERKESKFLHGILVVTLMMFTIGAMTSYGETITVSITAGEHDAEEHVNALFDYTDDEASDITSSDLEIMSDGDDGLDWQIVGLQFDALGIPQGSTINSAKVTFTVDNTGATGDNKVTVYAEAVDDSADFADAVGDLADRVKTTASVSWTVSEDPEAVAENDKIETPDLATIIQEVVNRAAWSDDNMLSILFYPDVYIANPDGSDTIAAQEIEMESYDGEAADAASLTIDFTPPAVPVPDPLKVDFGTTDSAVQEGFEAYTATNEDADTFTAEEYEALGGTITVTPTWADGFAATALQMWSGRGADENATDATDLTDDWIGTDPRAENGPGDPMTLTLSGIPEGTYNWTSYHHDEQDQGSAFTVKITDSTSTDREESGDITSGNAGVKLLSNVGTLNTTVTSNGTDDIVFVFYANGTTGGDFFVMNGFELAVNVPGNSITSNINPQFVAEGDSVTLRAPEGSSYEWYLNDEVIEGATESTLTLDPITLADGGIYTVSYDGSTSPGFWLPVKEAGEVPVSGLIGLAALMGACAFTGAGLTRRRR